MKYTVIGLVTAVITQTGGNGLVRLCHWLFILPDLTLRHTGTHWDTLPREKLRRDTLKCERVTLDTVITSLCVHKETSNSELVLISGSGESVSSKSWMNSNQMKQVLKTSSCECTYASRENSESYWHMRMLKCDVSDWASMLELLYATKNGE